MANNVEWGDSMSVEKTSPLLFGEVYDLFRGDEDFYFLCSASGRVLFTAGSLKLFLEGDLTGRNLNDFLPDTLAANIIAASFQKEYYEFRCELLGKHFRGSAEPSDGYIVIMLFPVSEDGKAFIRKTSAQFISREISDQLSLMSAALTLLRNEIGQTELHRKLEAPLSLLGQGIMRLLRLARNMLDCALYENGALPLCLREGDMAAFCRDLSVRLAPICQKAGIDLSWSLPDQPVICLFDEEKVERMILNLLSNAIKAGRDAPIEAELSDRGGSVAITVTDHGGGIAGEAMRTVMNKHVLASPEQGGTAGGAGFGLALLRAFAARHGGTLIMSSNTSGTSACISLPKNLAQERMALNAARLDYAGGFDHILLELSDVLGKELY